MRWMKALAAAAAIVALVVGIPIGLIQAVGNPWPAEGVDLMAPLTDGVIIGVLAAAMWVLWAQLVICIVVEAVATVRSRGSEISVPGVLGAQQQLARVLVGAIAVAIASVPALSSSSAIAATSSTSPVSSETTVTPTPTATIEQAETAPQAEAYVMTSTVTVHRGDTLWSLAEEHLGDGQRWRELAEANEGRQMVDGTTFRGSDLLRPGWELSIPGQEAARPDSSQVTVEAGDTLSQIALDKLGDANAYPEIFEASKDIEQPGGAHLIDPDHIEPGWTLKIGPTDAEGPAEQAPPALEREEPAPVEAEPVAPAQPEADATPSPAAEPTAKSAGEQQAQAEDSAQATAQEDQDLVPGWVLPSLAVGGGVLTSALLALMAARRVGRWRSRRPGWVPTTAPAPARSAEAAIEVSAAEAVVDVDELDQVLRRLSASLAEGGLPLPVLAAVEVRPREIALHLREPADAPRGWARSEDDRVWFLDRPVDLELVGPDVDDRPAPWPLLAALGSEGDSTWLLNLEGLAVVISGDQARARDIARYVVAEIATNPWSRDATVDVVGLEAQLARLNPDRVTHRSGVEAAEHAAHEAAARSLGRLDATIDTHTARHENSDPDTWPAHLLIVDALASTNELDELSGLIAAQGARTGASLLFSNSTAPNTETLTLEVDSAGTLRIEAADLLLAAVQLSADEADAFGQLLAHLDDGDQDRPGDLGGEQPWEEFATTTGSLRDEYRTARVEAPAASLLPEPDETYMGATATTAEDLEELAPSVTPDVTSAVLAADPDLDADLAEWTADVTSRPRLSLLGPVWLRASGEALAKRRPYYTELAAYLLSREHGATTDEVAAALGISPDRARADVNVLRKWLGTAPDGQRYLPDARTAPAAERRGVGVYQIVGALTDLDLLRRLRVRAEARGHEGLSDLEAALDLVTDRPFSQLRPGGWAWLFDGDRTDQHAVVAIADIAHVLVTARLQEGDTAGARAAVERALIAAPDDDITRLNLAAVLEAEGHADAAANLVQSQVCNRTGEVEAPTELTERNAQVIERRDWDRRKAV